MANKQLKIGTIYRLKWRGSFGFEHIYFGELTNIERGKIIFDNDLYLSPKDIIWIIPSQSKDKLFKLVEVHQTLIN